ncbi:NAD-dependent succinate-semialdehyde dehydrogenase [Phenylobacterium deserti]|uniref:NAD-dependent succinate-semialdehyde dehydrogenase n=1 Tax=Phenylobacterium deserti TaxID=1914756 RepID=A0A328A8B7_9CAUL|nr:NAD-dependent succinate-semialdehyde dehydrogenase [Phenylobacterium deserti]RAK50761.1 NAD-dependent succinate-semialdehyde dehydrogenase [Phenylobacterium deserti]
MSVAQNLAEPASAYKTDLYIDGAWRAGSGGKRFDVVDPSTGKLIATVADGTVEDAKAAVDAAAAAAAGWAATPPRKRAEILRKAFELMTGRAEEFAQLISLENGKALPDARGEVAYAAEFFRWFSEEAVRVIGEVSTAPSGANRIFVQYQPIGIAVLITPWNFPAAMATRKIAPALAAGCTCVLKPAAETPLTAFLMADVLEEAGVPKGVVNIVTTTDPGPVVDTMLNDPRVRKLSFTGSTKIGRLLLSGASKQVLSCSMELGGNAPFVVFDDADLEAALDGAMLAKMRNGGEACTAANRFYVQAGIYDAFVKGFADRMAALKVGPGYEEATQCGPVITPVALNKIDSLVQDAVSAGAKAIVGGQPLEREGFFYPPTVLTEVPASAKILQEEIFGPVAPVVKFTDESEAIEAANDTEYGLISYVYTKDLARGLRVSEKLEAGMIGLNRGIASDPAAPFGGVKQSGLGREGAHHGILEFLEAKYIAVTW